MNPRPAPHADIRPLRAGLLAFVLTPLAVLIWNGVSDELGANPIEAVERFTGWWALALLMMTLAVTPIRILTGWSALASVRRLLGLSAFFWACLHLASYVGLDQFFAWRDIAKDVVKRPYITVGFSAFLLLIPLAMTSTDAMIHRLGGSRWRKLHRLVYLAAIGGVLHFLWLVKADIAEPLLFGSLLSLLFAVRVRRPASHAAVPSRQASRKAA